MNYIKLLLKTTLIIYPLLFVLSCDPLPSPENSLCTITYEVSGDVNAGDITFSNETLEQMVLTGETLPWSVAFDVPKDESIALYLKVQIDPGDMTSPLVTGSSTSYVANELHDNSVADIFSLVEPGDYVFLTGNIGPGDGRSEIEEVLTNNSLELATNFITSAGVSYSIMREKGLTLTIKVDEDILITDTDSDLHSLSVTLSDNLSHYEE